MTRPSHVLKIALGVFAVILAVLGTALGVAWAVADSPPSGELAALRDAIGRARQAGADRFAPELLARAEVTADSVTAGWREENARFFFRRDFLALRDRASRGCLLADAAADSAVARAGSLHAGLVARGVAPVGRSLYGPVCVTAPR